MKIEKLKRMRTLALRVIPMITAVIVLVSSLTFSASAAWIPEDPPLHFYDYNDYKIATSIDGDYEIVTGSLPVADSEWQIYVEDGPFGRYFNTMSIPVNIHPDYVTDVYCYPHGSGNRLKLSNIKKGTKASVVFSVSSDTSEKADFITAELYYCDSSGRLFMGSEGSSYVTDTWLDGSTVELTFNISPPAGAVGVMLRISLQDLTSPYEYDYDTEITLLSYTLDLSISSMYILQQQTGETNRLLEDVSDQLESQGKTLEEILNGTKEDQDAADEFKDKADSAIGDLGSAGDALDSLEKPSVNVGSLVPPELLGTSYLNYISVLSVVWNQRTLTSMVTIMVGFFLLSLLLFGKKG